MRSEEERVLQHEKIHLLRKMVYLMEQQVAQIDDQNALVATLVTSVAAIKADVDALVANPPTGPDLTANNAAIAQANTDLAAATASLKGAFPNLP